PSCSDPSGSSSFAPLVAGVVVVPNVERSSTHPVIDRVVDGTDLTVRVGFGVDQDVLEEAGVCDAGALAAVTSGDNTNILTARIARETFEIPRVVARIYDPRRAAIYQRLGIPTVATVSWTVDQVVRRILPDEAVTAWTDSTGEVSIVEHVLPDAFAGRSLQDLSAGDRYRPVLLTRGGQARLAGPDTVAQQGDLLLFAVRVTSIDELAERLQAGNATAPAGLGR
ncbi:MAG: potassium channel family protein, partial [Acidimicrobiales bacterium]